MVFLRTPIFDSVVSDTRTSLRTIVRREHEGYSPSTTDPLKDRLSVGASHAGSLLHVMLYGGLGVYFHSILQIL